MTRIILVAVVGIINVWGASAVAAGSGNVEVHLNGGDDVAYIGEMNTLDIWIQNDQELTRVEIGFAWDIGRAGSLDRHYTEDYAVLKKHGDAVESLEDITDGVLQIGRDPNWNLHAAFLWLEGDDHPLPVHPTATLCYSLRFEIYADQDELANGVSIDNTTLSESTPSTTDNYKWRFTGADGAYAPDYNGNANSSVSVSDAPPITFHIVNRERAQCCQGQVGDVNASGGDTPTISDVATLVDHLFVSGGRLFCAGEADINQSGGSVAVDGDGGDITISDVAELVDHLFVSGQPLRKCF